MWPFKRKPDPIPGILLDITNIWEDLRELRGQLGMVKPDIQASEDKVITKLDQTQEALKGTIAAIQKELIESVKLTDRKSSEDILSLESNLKDFFGIHQYKKTQANRSLFQEGGLLAEILNTLKETNYFVKNINKNYKLVEKDK